LTGYAGLPVPVAPDTGPLMSLTCAIGDIHGQIDQLRELVAQCRHHAANRPVKFVTLGDYIDRGPDSAGVIRFLMDLESQGDLVALKGNHEWMALGALDGTLAADDWLGEGGAATLRSYSVESAGDLPASHVAWLRARPPSYDDGRRFFVHAGIDPARPLAEQRKRDLIWIRERFLHDRRDHGRLIVHGHTPAADGLPELRPNRINLDTGAVYGGPLTAAMFSDASTEPETFLQVDQALAAKILPALRRT
jgi:serine/threonine protein phosphatase 1